MSELQDNTASGGAPETPPIQPWRERLTLRQIWEQEEVGLRDYRVLAAEDQTRLPADENVTICGISIAEVFTTSTFPALEKSISKILINDPTRRDELIENLKNGARRNTVGGWRDLGTFVPREVHWNDIQIVLESLPEGVKAMYLYAHPMTPSVTAIVATFVLDEGYGDMSNLLRSELTLQRTVKSIEPHGKYARFLKKLPGYKPKAWTATTEISNHFGQRVRRSDDFISKIESDVQTWFYSIFRGAFSDLLASAGPNVRLLLTERGSPFEPDLFWLKPLGLDRIDASVWASEDANSHWKLRISSSFEGRFFWTAGAKRSNFAPNRVTGKTGNMEAAYTFHATSSQLVALWYLENLIKIYSQRLNRLKDATVARGILKGSIFRAKRLNNFLLGEGLDAASIAHDLKKFSEYGRIIAGGPRYQCLDDSKSSSAEVKTVDLGARLWRSIEHSSSQLELDTSAMLANIRASANLQQSITNTQLQWFILGISILAIIIAIFK